MASFTIPCLKDANLRLKAQLRGKMLDAVMQNFCEWRKRPFSPLVKREKICYNRQSIPDY